jgi:putative tricarboxylic transport membrane protein
MSDRILGAVCVVASCRHGLGCTRLRRRDLYEPVGPRAFPLLLAGLLAIAAPGW